MKILITTVPFGVKDQLPLKLLEQAGVEYLINPLNKKLTEEELLEMVSDFDIIIAGTEPITSRVIQKSGKLKMISRVGIGLDSVDLLAAKRNNVVVSYTPDAPAPAVSELTIGLMLTLLRSVHVANMKMHKGEWHRYFGRRLSESTVGIIGMGRIGIGVLKHLAGFNCNRILVNDINIEARMDGGMKVEWVEKDVIYREADIISLHVPLTVKTKNMIKQKELRIMKSNAIIINTSRGGIINEKDLYNTMKEGHLAGASIDVFESEPYKGELSEIERCLLTSHMGSMSEDCRSRMEIEATEEVLRYIADENLEGVVPDLEYIVQQEGL
jgi:D-3-phosphoglycerate dehydrogenase / 2-oxoglutarate reductase